MNRSGPCRFCGRSKEAHEVPPFEYAELLGEQSRCWNGYAPGDGMLIADAPRVPDPEPELLLEVRDGRIVVVGQNWMRDKPPPDGRYTAKLVPQPPERGGPR